VANDGGYVRNLEEKRGKPGRWVVGDPLPEAFDLLPDPAQLCNSATLDTTLDQGGCAVAPESEGYSGDTPSPPDDGQHDAVIPTATNGAGGDAQALRLGIVNPETSSSDNGQSPPGFIVPTGPDRCSECGFHVGTQGHRESCTA
jgi:hypothetical protein